MAHIERQTLVDEAPEIKQVVPDVTVPDGEAAHNAGVVTTTWTM